MKANLRTGAPIMFGDEASRARWEADCQAALRIQRVQYAIAPAAQYTTHDGRTLRTGDEFVPSRDLAYIKRVVDHHGSPCLDERAVWQQLDDLVFRGVVLRAWRDDDGPKGAA